MSTYEGRSKSNSLRASFIRQMALNWVRIHRPDVEQAIKVEADKLYPLSGIKKSKLKLPESLENLK